MNKNHVHTHLQSFTLKPFAIAALLTLSGNAIATEFIPLLLPTDTYRAYAISADGSVVAGSGTSNAFVWTNGVMTDLGTLGGTYSSASAISANGSAVAGYSTTAGNALHAFRWISGTGMTDLGTLGGTQSISYAISADGSTVVGYADIVGGTEQHAFRWTSGTGMTDLGTLGGNFSNAIGISADGSAVAGHSLTAGNALHAFRWTSGTGMTDLGTLGGMHSESKAISADGSAVVGHALTAGNEQHAFRWTSGTGVTDLGTLGGAASDANAISADGSAVVGYAFIASNAELHAFRWTSGTGMTDLGALGGVQSDAKAISADGSTVVGYALTLTAGVTEQHAFRWTQATGMQSVPAWLNDAGVTLPVGWKAQNANAVNQNGSVVVGDGTDANGNTQAYLARVGPNAGVITDINAFNRGLIEAGSRYAQAGTALPNLTLFGAHHRSILDNGLVRTTENGTCGWATADVARYNNTRTRAELAEVGLCKDFSSARLGIGIGNAWTQQSLLLDGSARYNGQYLLMEAANAFDNGLQPSITGYYGRFDTKLSRHYMNGASVDGSHASPDSNVYALRARLDWKDATAIGRFSLSPYAAYTWSKSKLDAYTETGGGFPAHFAASTWTTNDLRVGTAITTALSPATDLRLGAEVAHRFEDNTSGVNGQVVGLFSFALEGQHITQTWTRATVDVDHRITDKVAFTIGGNTATTGGDASWGVTAGLRANF